MANGQMQITPNIQQALQSYGILNQGIVEAHPQSFYDYQAYPAAGQLSFQFFQNSIGNNGYTAGRTNMPANGQFPNPQNFLWTGIEVIFFSGQSNSGAAALEGKSYLDDVSVVLTAKAYCNFIINTKEYFRECPLAAAPMAFNINGAVATGYPGVVAAVAWSGGDMIRTSGQLIPSNTQFVGNIAFDALVPTPSTVAGTIGMKIHGIWYQLSQ